MSSRADALAGQIELYTHHPLLPQFVAHLTRLGVRTCATYLLESQFMEDKYKFFRLARPLLHLSVSLVSQRCHVCYVLDGQL